MFIIFEKMGKIIIQLIIIFLIIIISVQIILQDKQANLRLKHIEKAAINLFLNQERAVRVTDEINYMTVESKENRSLSDVWLLINNKRIDNFSDGKITFTFQEGDIIIIDSTSYKNELSFKITAIHPSIVSINKGDIIKTRGNKSVITIIEFDKKI